MLLLRFCICILPIQLAFVIAISTSLFNCSFSDLLLELFVLIFVFMVLSRTHGFALEWFAFLLMKVYEISRSYSKLASEIFVDLYPILK